MLDRFAAIAARRGVGLDLRHLRDQAPVVLSATVQDTIADAAERTGHAWRSMPSGAGHDSAHLASIAPTAMLFVPSRGGRSHCPEEWTDAADLAAGVHTLTAALHELDRSEAYA